MLVQTDEQKNTALVQAWLKDSLKGIDGTKADNIGLHETTLEDVLKFKELQANGDLSTAKRLLKDFSIAMRQDDITLSASLLRPLSEINFERIEHIEKRLQSFKASKTL